MLTVAALSLSLMALQKEIGQADLQRIGEQFMERLEKSPETKPWISAANEYQKIAENLHTSPEIRLEAWRLTIRTLAIGPEPTANAYCELAKLANLPGMDRCIANVRGFFSTPDRKEWQPAFGLCDSVFKNTKDLNTKAGALFGKGTLYPRGSKEQLSYFRRASTEYSDLHYGKVAARYLNELLSLEIGNVMPNFEGKDSSGNIVSLAASRGKYVLLDCWASWCGPCMRLLPHTIEIAKNYSDKLAVIGIGGDKKLRLQKWAELDLKVPFPTIFSGGYDRGVPLQLNVVGWPTYYLLDPQGKIVEKWVGGVKESELDAKLRIYLAY